MVEHNCDINNHCQIQFQDQCEKIILNEKSIINQNQKEQQQIEITSFQVNNDTNTNEEEESIFKNSILSIEMQQYKELVGNCMCVSQFSKVSTLGEGTYGKVWGALEIESNAMCALKQVKIHDRENGFPITALREIIQLQQHQQHPNIVKLESVVVGYKPDSIFLRLEHCAIDLANLTDQLRLEGGKRMTEAEIKCLTLQIMNGLQHLHKNNCMHRDLKLSNLLLTENGIVKLADFGMIKQMDKPYQNHSAQVVTLWYRAPELLLDCVCYNQKIDAWSMGCVLAELINDGHPLFPGKTPLHMFQLVCEAIGFPSPKQWKRLTRHIDDKTTLVPFQAFRHFKQNTLHLLLPKCSAQCIDLLSNLLRWNAKDRITIVQAMIHPYFFSQPRPTMSEELSFLKKLTFYSNKCKIHHYSKVQKQQI